MSKIVIEGPSILSGKVQIQGAKNAAMKHVFIPLMSDETFTLTNIPKIGSITKHLELISFLDAKVHHKTKHTLIINAEKLSRKTIPKEFLYYTSDGNKIIPILASRFGSCTIEIDPNRNDRGGDQIGSRSLDDIIETLKLCGIDTSKKVKSQLTFTPNSYNPFGYAVPFKSFSASVLSLFAALFKKGKSTISNYTATCEFEDILNFLILAGAKIKKTDNSLFVWGPTKLHATTYKNMYDPHDLITWISGALSTNSEIEVNGIEFTKMKLDVLEKVFTKMNIKLDLRSSKSIIHPQLNNIKPTDLHAGQYPLSATEWQVLLSPLLTQIKGQTKVVETFFANRMLHWNEMKKMGAIFDFYKDPEFPEVDNNPRAVKVIGKQNLYGCKVTALDVRCGAALVIAGLIAHGRTEISNIDHIDRGYENLVGRLQKLGAKIKNAN